MKALALHHIAKAQDAIKFKDLDENFEDIVLFAWALLIGNLDLIRWSLCMALGPSDAAIYYDRVSKVLLGERLARIQVHGVVSEDFVDPTAAASSIRRVLKLNVDHASWVSLLAVWRPAGSSGSGSVVGCRIVATMQIICHEVYHLCDVPQSPCHSPYLDDPECGTVTGSYTCDAVYNATALLGFGLTERYSFTQDTLYCCQSGDMIANFEYSPASQCI